MKKTLCLLIILALALSFAGCTWEVEEVFLMSSTSPDGKYRLEAYRVDPGATVDFSIKVYLIEKDGKKQIYNAYHEDEVRMEWVSDTEVIINGIMLDVSQNESFDWRG